MNMISRPSLMILALTLERIGECNKQKRDTRFLDILQPPNEKGKIKLRKWGQNNLLDAADTIT